MSHGFDLRMASAVLPIGACSIRDRAWVPTTNRSVFCRASSSLTRASASPFSMVTKGLALTQLQRLDQPVSRNARLAPLPDGPRELASR